jgi:hypothetical protein
VAARLHQPSLATEAQPCCRDQANGIVGSPIGEKINPDDWDPPLFDNDDIDNPESNPRFEDLAPEILAEWSEEQIQALKDYWEYIEARHDVWGEDEDDDSTA